VIEGQQRVIGLLAFLAAPIGVVALGSVFPHNSFVPFVAFLIIGLVLLFVARLRIVGVGLVFGTLATLLGLFLLASMLAPSID
jgi:hypothetical protein